MKKLIILLVIVINCQLSFAQAPQGFNYQAVARTSTGVAVTNQAIGLQIRLLQGSATGASVYSETHSVISNNIGLINVVVGYGVSFDSFSSINWANGPYFIEISMDITGGAAYVLMGTQQLMSVPYALYAANGGTTGAMGATGVMGATGDIGPSGAIGVTGDVGPTGAMGATGTSGFNGDRYATTSTDMLTIGMGMQSLTVQTGLQYSVGQTVLIANSVTDMMKGNCVSYNSLTGALVVNVTIIGGSGTFNNWDVNLDGAPGPAGPIGLTGATGLAGSNGTDGTDGATGATGSNGLPGTNGLNGINGATGATGTAGTNGLNGSNGSPGLNGTNGVDGATGVTGTAGTNGLNGAPGLNGTNGTNGATGATGATATYAVAFNLVNNGFTAWAIGNTSDYNSGNNLNPTLTLYRGLTYQFNVNVSGHPFRIQSVNSPGGALYTVGITPLGQNVQNGILTFKVPMDAPSQLYYFCNFHSGMTGIINIP